jgi:hypothetical protein
MLTLKFCKKKMEPVGFWRKPFECVGQSRQKKLVKDVKQHGPGQ